MLNFKMINFKMLATAAVFALVSPMAAPSFAQNSPANRPAPGATVHARAGMPAPRFGSPLAPRTFSGGGARTAFGPPVAQSSPNGGNWRGAEGWRGNQAWRGDEGWRGGRRRDRDRGFVSGLVTGALIGGAIASQNYGYYGGPAYYAPSYTDDQYYDRDGVAVAPADDDAVAYCIQNYSSYDPNSGTYLGNDGFQHPCP